MALVNVQMNIAAFRYFLNGFVPSRGIVNQVSNNKAGKNNFDLFNIPPPKVILYNFLKITL